MYSPKAKYLYIGRDGRDVVWSFYNHHSNANQSWYDALNETPGRVGPPIERPPEDIRQYWREWMDGDGFPFWSFWENVRSWWEISELPNLLLVHFTELKRALFGLPSDVRFNILCFDQRMFFFTGAGRAKELVPATTANKARCERWINDLPAGEKTDVNRSVAAGLAMLREALVRDPRSRAELFILTDGRETARTTSLKVVQAQYNKLPTNRCQVHVISLGGRGTPSLRVLADGSGGRFVEAR